MRALTQKTAELGVRRVFECAAPDTGISASNETFCIDKKTGRETDCTDEIAAFLIGAGAGHYLGLGSCKSSHTLKYIITQSTQVA